MNRTRGTRQLICVGWVLGLAACGGNNATSINGSLSGLNAGASVTLQDNGADNLTLSANGPFHFATFVPGGSSYNVTILTQPAGQVCEVTSGSGTLDASGDPVSTAVVTCVTTASVSGTVSGLASGTSVTLSNGGELLPVAVNGAFAFPGTLPVGSAYAVTVAVQPVGEICTVANGTGTVDTNVANPVTVSCS